MHLSSFDSGPMCRLGKCQGGRACCLRGRMVWSADAGAGRRISIGVLAYRCVGGQSLWCWRCRTRLLLLDILLTRIQSRRLASTLDLSFSTPSHSHGGNSGWCVCCDRRRIRRCYGHHIDISFGNSVRYNLGGMLDNVFRAG